MDCPNGCHNPLVVEYEGEWDEHLHCSDCGANWSWQDAREYAEKQTALKSDMATPCPHYWDERHQFQRTIAWNYDRCACGKVVNLDCSPTGVR